MNINWQKLFVSLTILALGLSFAGCGKTASGGGSSGGGGNNYQRTSDTVETIDELLNALETVDDVIISGNITITDNVTIPAGKTLTVEENARLNVSADATIELEGIIRVKEGGQIIDEAYGTPGAQQWQQNNNAELIFEAGSRGLRYSGTTPYTFIGTDNSAIVHLKEGTLALKNDAYILDGEADVGTGYQLLASQVLTITEGSVATINGTVNLNAGAAANIYGKLAVESGKELHVNGKLNVYGTYTTAADDNWNTGNDSGTIVYHYGATGIVNGVTRLASDDSATALQLGNGAIFEMTKDSYTVAAGTVISKQVTHIGGSAPVNSITVNTGATLTLQDNLNVWTSGTLTVESGGNVSPVTNVVKNGGTVNGITGYTGE
ncbi:MAG: hypothetical protein LBK68_00870 [Candidatus Margulisbacteria bacterium]|jgi:hypothetical protein|nr:hypothetical protein [Candidatus Margulisiibacteriota bacterium]